jgi:hypothetical protein
MYIHKSKIEIFELPTTARFVLRRMCGLTFGNRSSLLEDATEINAKS